MTAGEDAAATCYRCREQGGQMDPAVLTVFVIAILMLVVIANGALRKRR
jgi:hypothetical protein